MCKMVESSASRAARVECVSAIKKKIGIDSEITKKDVIRNRERVLSWKNISKGKRTSSKY